ncbi:MAG: hypothetical protein JNL14_16065 [Devosia sp.]|uniref:hypothetical protein n=1 Tax=Devosia sp. TaxID=1871048 RepID=UPI001A41F401|nr:hypothetical protein [Devosia sp.]MBL8599249.1 hypothetical protein [Devosia sp.]
MAVIGTLREDGWIVRTSDGASVPPDPANLDYLALLAAVDGGDTIAAWRPPEPAHLRTISKDAIWRRATDEEAELMEAALQAQPVRLQRIYEGATFISTEDELYGVLEAALIGLFGPGRASELLESPL